MENASKALLMAGGILVFILIVSVFMLMYQSASELPKTQEQIKEAKELANFNKQYEVYERDNLKGTDVTSVVNMAMSYNQQNPDLKPIVVRIKLKDAIVETVEHYEDDNNDGKPTKQTSGSSETVKVPAGEILSYENKSTDSTELSNIIHFSTYDDVSNKDKYYVDAVGNKIEEPTNWLDYYVKSNPYATFKRMKFRCADVNNENNSGIKYNADGRISEINFVGI